MFSAHVLTFCVACGIALTAVARRRVLRSFILAFLVRLKKSKEETAAIILRNGDALRATSRGRAELQSFYIFMGSK
jgi:hypothetical protein